MTRRNEAPGGQPGALGRQTGRGEAFVSCLPQEYHENDDLSRLLDQAVALAELHEAQAWEHWRLAARHRAIKRALEQLAEVRT